MSSSLPMLPLGAALSAIGGTLGSANPTLNADEIAYITALLTSVSNAARAFTNRDWDQTTYDELHHRDRGYGCANQRDDTYDRAAWIVLKQYPVTAMNFLLGCYNPVMWINQTDTVTNQFASAQALATGLQLSRTASAVQTIVTAGLDWTSCPTITALVAAINALGKWTAQANQPYGAFPAANLFIAAQPLQTANVLGYQRNMFMHTSSLDGFIDPPTGRLNITNNPNAWPLELDYGQRYRRTIRVNYTAGYPTAVDPVLTTNYTDVPGEVQEAIAQWIAAIFYKSKANPQAGNLFTAGTGQAVVMFEANMPPATTLVLAKYKQRNV